MNIFVDLDNTLCINKNNSIKMSYIEAFKKYNNAIPIEKNINKINKLYEDGNTISIWTNRGSDNKIDYTAITKEQLLQWGVKYDHLIFGKPSYDLLVDDKSINLND